MSDWLTDLLSPVAGRRIAGGCEDCDAWQTAHRDAIGMWHLTVHHDDTCPTYRVIQQQRGSRA